MSILKNRVIKQGQGEKYMGLNVGETIRGISEKGQKNHGI